MQGEQVYWEERLAGRVGMQAGLVDRESGKAGRWAIGEEIDDVRSKGMGGERGEREREREKEKEVRDQWAWLI